MNAFCRFRKKNLKTTHAITKPIKNMISIRLQRMVLKMCVSRPFQLPPFKNFV